MPDLPDPKAHAHPRHRSNVGSGKTAGSRRRDHRPRYAELCVTSNFTFLTGASHPDELKHRAAELGYQAIAVTDHNTLAGVVRAHVAAKEAGIPLIVGCRLVLSEPDWLSLLVYPVNRQAYGNLSRLLTVGKRRAPKGECFLSLSDLVEHGEGLLGVVLLPSAPDSITLPKLRVLRDVFDDDRLSMALVRRYGPEEEKRIHRAEALAKRIDVPLVAVNDVYYHAAKRKPLQDVLTCIRHGCTIPEAGFRLFPNAERYLKDPEDIARMFAAHPDAFSRTMEIADRAR